jgi:hypothetical protein
MTQTRKSIQGGKCLMLGAFAIVVLAAVLAAAVQPLAAQQVQKKTFKLYPNPKFIACAGVQGGPTPSASVTVVRGSLADTLYISGKNFQPNLGFDLFTIQRSELLSNGQVDPNFTNFGQAWYQTDLQTDAYGNFNGNIKTILLDQIFGFDSDVNLAPTQALHVGIWFDDPNAAAACGFNVNNPTPFNGQHKAGPNVLISLPNATTDLGPLCTKPIKQGSIYVCNINQ